MVIGFTYFGDGDDDNDIRSGFVSLLADEGIWKVVNCVTFIISIHLFKKL